MGKNKELLVPIIQPLQKQAESRVTVCEKEIKLNNDKQTSALDGRAKLYVKLSNHKNELSNLDLKRIRISGEITLLSKEISNDNTEIARLQNEIARVKKENEYWNTVFYATCWIPFVNIGTGVKKHVEDGQYHAEIKVKGREIKNKQKRISNLNDKLLEISTEQSRNAESSGRLANQITSIEGEVAAVTNLINGLKSEIGLWQTILTACYEISNHLQNVNGKIEVVKACFKRLLEVENLLVLPTITKYINGCKSKGDVIAIGQKLYHNEYLISNNRRFVAVMQSYNNFVVYNSEKPIWASNTWGAYGKGYIELDKNGLVSLKETNRKWDTKRSGAVVLVMQDDGNLVTYDKNNNPLWASDTYTYANVPSICFAEN